jgi:hypothetical protein
MSAGPATASIPLPSGSRLALRIRAHLWLVGWWAVGRLVVITGALIVHPSIWTLGTWDGRWYRMIARDGYLLVPGRQSDPAFFPLYPILLRALHAVGIGYGVGGPLLSNLALLPALIGFFALTEELVGRELARRATTYLAIFPLGYAFSMTYPESVVLALIVAAALAARHGRWWLAAVCGAAAALGRPEALFLAVPLAATVWRSRHSLRPLTRGVALGAVVAPGAALASYPLYLATVLHDPLAWQRAERAWGRNFQPLGPVTAFRDLPSVLGADPWLVRDLLALLLYGGLLAAAARIGAPRSWLVAGAVVVGLPVFSGAFDSIGRFGLLVPPLFWGLASLGRRPHADRAIRMASLALLVGATVTLPHVFP